MLGSSRNSVLSILAEGSGVLSSLRASEKLPLRLCLCEGLFCPSDTGGIRDPTGRANTLLIGVVEGRIALKNGIEQETTCKLKSLIGDPGDVIEGMGLLMEAAMAMLE